MNRAKLLTLSFALSAVSCASVPLPGRDPDRAWATNHGNEWQESWERQNSKIRENYDAGYSGEPIFDKQGRLIVFEGPEVGRDVAKMLK